MITGDGEIPLQINTFNKKETILSSNKFTINIREFNDHVLKDKRVEQIIIPLGDGMTICRVL